ncbi:MAG: phage tail protein [Nitrososphaerota archaeon]
MARARATDFLQVTKFKVVETARAGEQRIVVAGFTSIDIPALTLEEVTYREGTTKFTRKQPGIPTFDNIVLRKGIARIDSKFAKWILDIVDGKEYRIDFTILHFHGDEDASGDTATREYTFFEAFPVNFVPSSGLDASSSDISIEELQIAFEKFNVKVNKANAEGVGAVL